MFYFWAEQAISSKSNISDSLHKKTVVSMGIVQQINMSYITLHA